MPVKLRCVKGNQSPPRAAKWFETPFAYQKRLPTPFFVLAKWFLTALVIYEQLLSFTTVVLSSAILAQQASNRP